MDKQWKLPVENFSPDSRVWIYQSNRPFGNQELKEIEEQLQQFHEQWISHNRPVKGWAGVLFNQFVVIVGDDTMDRLCGSAVDNSIRLIKSMERQYNISLLDRMLLAFLIEDKIQILPVNQFPHAFNSGKIMPETLYFNNAVTTKSEMENNWLVEVKNSWLGKRFLQGTFS